MIVFAHGHVNTEKAGKHTLSTWRHFFLWQLGMRGHHRMVLKQLLSRPPILAVCGRLDRYNAHHTTF